MATQMAILQEVDKCIRCNGCVISCKRTWQMKGIVPSNNLPHAKVDYNQRVVIKSAKRTDAGPYVRYSCWHCSSPPCAGHCPFHAISKDAEGGVNIDPALCNPSACSQQCKFDCQKGGYPKIGVGSDLYGTEKAWKCTLCHGRAGENGDLPTKLRKKVENPPASGQYDYYSVLQPSQTYPALRHQPSCVYTCPANAMVYDTRANILAYVLSPAQGWMSYVVGGSMFWASRRFLIASPKADPFVEDHLSPMLSSLLSNPFAKAALAPTLVVGGLLALAARRAKIAEEVPVAAVGEAR